MPWMPEPTDYAERPPRATLSGAPLLALQLLARGYSPDQIAALRGVPAVAVLTELGDALRLLDTTNVREAVREARRRGLIV